jgi:hypothetical protein
VLTSDGVDLIDAVITLKEEKPAAAGGLLNYPTLSQNLAQPAPSAIVVNRIPFSGEITPATPVSVQFHFSNNDAARMLQPKRLIDAVYVKGTAFHARRRRHEPGGDERVQVGACRIQTALDDGRPGTVAPGFPSRFVDSSSSPGRSIPYLWQRACDEARRIAVNIAKLPELLGR